MALYKLHPLTLPNGYQYGRVKQINSNNTIVGSCGGNATSKATLWHQSNFTLLNVPGQYSAGNGLNSKGDVVGNVDGRPFSIIQE